MRKTRLPTLILIASLVAGAGAQAAPQRWTRVVTTAGFSLDQPLGWMSVGTAPDRVLVRCGLHRCHQLRPHGEAAR